MKICGWLPFIAAVVLFVAPVPAQQNLPESTQDVLAASARVEALTAGDFTTLLSQGQSGDRNAQYLLALTYERGLLVPRNFTVARSWMLKSAEQGYLPAQAGMGGMYLTNVRDNGAIPDYGDADRWLRLAATQGDASAQFWLGVGYERGYFGGIDYQESLKWLRKSAVQGLPDAQFNLGQRYEDGTGVPKSHEMAASWYRKAADHFSDVTGAFNAVVELGDMYRDGRLKGNDVEAYMWFAVRDSSVDPAIDPRTDDDLRRVAKRMTKSEIAEAQQRAREWTLRHLRRPD
jgi:TPR repeat protein